MKLLDLFCGEQGAGVGYAEAGFDVVGVDLDAKRLERAPLPVVQADALAYAAEHWHEYDAIHASPPCQSESLLRHRTGVEYDDLLGPTLRLLSSLPIPWVVENVETTKQMPGSTKLCGSMFGLRVSTGDGKMRTLRRHRRFLGSFPITEPMPCDCRGRDIVGVYGTGGGGQMTRGYKATLTEARYVMQMPWASRQGVSLAIPPAYTRHVGGLLLSLLTKESQVA